MDLNNDFDPKRDLRLVRDVPITPEQAFEGWTVPQTLMPWFCPAPGKWWSARST